MAGGQSSNGGSSSTNVSPGSSDSTLELRLKTLDSQIYRFHVEKDMPVSLFKEKIANEVGVPVNQQRLIFRAKPMKDEHVLSEHQVQNGDTLHLVQRLPNLPQTSGTASVETSGTASNSSPGNDAGSGAPRNRIGLISRIVVLGTSIVVEQVGGTAQNLIRVTGEVLNSLANGGQSTINLPNSTQHSSAPIWWWAVLAPPHGIEQGENAPDDPALVRWWADLAPQHGIEQGVNDFDDPAWRRNTSTGNERPMGLDQFYGLLDGQMQILNRMSVQMFMRYVQENRRTNGLQQNDSTWRSFISFAAQNVRNLSPEKLRFLLILFTGILSVLTRTCTTQFESFQVGKTTYALEEVFYEVFLEVARITCFIIGWFMTLIVILLQQRVLQKLFGLLCSAIICFGLLCSAIICFVLLEKKTSASGVHVACGDSLKLSLFWFVIMQAVGFSLIIGLMIFVIAYLSWAYMLKENPTAVVEVIIQISVEMIDPFNSL